MVIYETVNKIDGKKYIGKDAKNCDSYIGSGKHLKCAIKKYGRENFQKTIIETCNDLSHLAEREKFWIEYYDAVNSPKYYNMMVGGEGGDSLTNHPKLEEIKKRISIGTSKDQLGIKNILPKLLKKYENLIWERNENH